MIEEMLKLKEKAEALTADTIPDVYGADDLMQYYILHGDLTRNDVRQILHNLYLASSVETGITAVYVNVNHVEGYSEETERTLEELCNYMKPQLQENLNRALLKNHFTTIPGGKEK